MLESTPSGASGCFYEEWQSADEMGYARHFFPWWYEASYRSEHEISALTAGEQKLVTLYQLTPKQIAFRRQMRAELSGLASQEFAEDPESCFLGSGECVFDEMTVRERLGQCPLPIRSSDNGRLLAWWPPQPRREYVIGVDPAGGGSEGDYSCAEVVDKTTGLQCAELRGHFPPRELAKRVAGLGREYNLALIAVERNNHGHGVIAHLTSTEAYPRLYEEGGQIGWLTSAISRPMLVENVAALLATSIKLVSSQHLLNECRTFVRQADGMARAASGSHDDCIMAMAIALAVRAGRTGSYGGEGGVSFAMLPNRDSFHFELT